MWWTIIIALWLLSGMWAAVVVCIDLIGDKDRITLGQALVLGIIIVVLTLCGALSFAVAAHFVRPIVVWRRKK